MKKKLSRFMVFWTIFYELIKLQKFEWLNRLHVSDIINANEDTEYANSGLDVNFFYLNSLLSFCFMMKKDHFIQKNCYFGLRSPLINIKYIYIYMRVCLPAENAKNVSWPWLSPLQGWGSRTMSLTGKFVYLAHYFILLWLNPFDHRVNREGWWFEYSVS